MLKLSIAKSGMLQKGPYNFTNFSNYLGNFLKARIVGLAHNRYNTLEALTIIYILAIYLAITFQYILSTLSVFGLNMLLVGLCAKICSMKKNTEDPR